jgi:hypothetical protein
MKKLALILALLLAMGGFAIAEMEPTITGDASIAFGYDLDEGTWGFANSNDSSLTLTLVSGSAEKMGEGAWYGVIELADFSIDFDDAGTHYAVEAEDGDDDALTITWGTLITADTPDEVFVNVPVSVTVPSITAKITDGNLYFQFCSEPDFDADFVAEIEDDDATDYGFDEDTLVAGSFEFGGTFGPATVALQAGTAGNYEDTDPQVMGFPLGLVIGLDVSPIMVDVALATGLAYDTAPATGIAFQVKADVAPLSVTAAFDMVLDGGTTDWEASAGISADVSPLTIGLDVYYGADLDLAIGLTADIAPLTVGVDVDLLNVIDALSWTVDATVDFAASEDIAVAAGFGMGSDDIIDANLSVEMTGIIDPMTFTLAWQAADDLTDVAADETEVLGEIVFTASIAY